MKKNLYSKCTCSYWTLQSSCFKGDTLYTSGQIAIDQYLESWLWEVLVETEQVMQNESGITRSWNDL
jgi:hypothetical protein